MSTRNEWWHTLMTDKCYFKQVIPGVLSLAPFWCHCQYVSIHNVYHTQKWLWGRFLYAEFIQDEPSGWSCESSSLKQKRDTAFRLWGGVAELFFGTDCSCLLPVSLSPVFTSSEARGWLPQALGEPVVAACIWKDPMCSPWIAVQQVSRRGVAKEGAVRWELSHTGSKPYRNQGFDANQM